MASSQKKNVPPNSRLFCMHDQATVNGFLCLISCGDRKKYDSPKIPALLQSNVTLHGVNIEKLEFPEIVFLYFFLPPDKKTGKRKKKSTNE